MTYNIATSHCPVWRQHHAGRPVRFPDDRAAPAGVVRLRRDVGINRSRAQVFSGYQSASARRTGAWPTSTGSSRRVVDNAFQPGGAQGNLMQPLHRPGLDEVHQPAVDPGPRRPDVSGRISGGVLTGTRDDGSPFRVAKPNTHATSSSAPVRWRCPNDQGGTDTDREVGRDFCAAFHRGVALNTVQLVQPGLVLPSKSTRDDYSAYLTPSASTTGRTRSPTTTSTIRVRCRSSTTRTRQPR